MFRYRDQLSSSRANTNTSKSTFAMRMMAINTNNDDINNTMFTNFHTLTTNYNNEGNNLIAFMTFIN